MKGIEMSKLNNDTLTTVDAIKSTMERFNALMKLADYILETEGENYYTWCEDNDLNPREIDGKMQSNHVYVHALNALGLTFEE